MRKHIWSNIKKSYETCFSKVFVGLMHGDVVKAKLYIRFEKSLLKLQKQFINLNTIIIQVFML